MYPARSMTFPLHSIVVVKMNFFYVDTSDVVFGVTYQLVSVASNKVLKMTSNLGDENPLWVIYMNNDGTVKLINPKNGKALDVSGAGTAAGTNVQLWTDNETNAQKWRIESLGDGIYKLINPHSGKVLDVKNGGTSDETNLQIWSDNDMPTQKWRLRRYHLEGEHVRFDLPLDNIQSNSTTF